jgi:cAMP-dependent protein kinase regulator
LVGLAGGDRKAALSAVALAFGAGSARVGASTAVPPPLPLLSPPQPKHTRTPLAGEALFQAAEQALAGFIGARDPVAEDTRLPRLPLFGALAPAVLARLLGVLQLHEYPAGRVVVRQGDDAQEVFLLVRGRLNVVREEPGTHSTVLAVLGPGAVFGEMALVSSVSRVPRAASVRCIEPAEVLGAPCAQLERLVERDPSIGKELARFGQKRMLANLIKHSRILSAVEPGKRTQLMGRFVTRSFRPGELLLRQGEEAGSLFLIASGLVEVRSVDADGDGIVLAQPGPGDVVGEISLVLRRPAIADVEALHGTVALELTWAAFHEAIREYPGLLQQLYEIATQREAETRSVVARAAIDVSDSVLL